MSAFAALRVPSYRRLLFGLTASELGLYVFETALFWTVLERTGSSVDVGLLFIALVLPMLVLTAPVGVLADRLGPRVPMLIGAVAGTLVLLGAAIIAYAGAISFETAMALSLLEGVFYALWAVPSQVLAGRVVDRRRVTSAIGLSSLPRGLGAAAGGLIGGLVLATGGPAPAFVVAALGVLLGGLSIRGIKRVEGFSPAPGKLVMVAQLGEALAWIRASAHLLALLGLALAAGMFMGSRFVLYPAVSRDVLDAGPVGLGLLTSAAGVGALVGTGLTDRTGRQLRRGAAILVGLVIAGAAYAAIGQLPIVAVALGLAATISLAMTIYQMNTTTLLQVIAPVQMRGRVLAVFDLVRVGLVPVGGVLGGLLAEVWGVSAVLGLLGGLTAATAVLVLVVKRDLPALDIDGEGYAHLGGTYLSREKAPPDGLSQPAAGYGPERLPGVTD